MERPLRNLRLSAFLPLEKRTQSIEITIVKIHVSCYNISSRNYMCERAPYHDVLPLDSGRIMVKTDLA